MQPVRRAPGTHELRECCFEGRLGRRTLGTPISIIFAGQARARTPRGGAAAKLNASGVVAKSIAMATTMMREDEVAARAVPVSVEAKKVLHLRLWKTSEGRRSKVETGSSICMEPDRLRRRQNRPASGVVVLVVVRIP